MTLALSKAKTFSLGLVVVARGRGLLRLDEVDVRPEPRGHEDEEGGAEERTLHRRRHQVIDPQDHEEAGQDEEGQPGHVLLLALGQEHPLVVLVLGAGWR